jgi:glycosyltransferase involved in cell wall biosynthesis
MRPLILSTVDTEGGAGRAAYRLHCGLKKENDVSSQMLVSIKRGDDSEVLAPCTALSRGLAYIRPGIDRLPLKVYPKRTTKEFSCQWLPDKVLGRIEEIQPDIVNIHWVCEGLASIRTLGSINYPTVWTLHDMWSFTGGCHYTADCTRYEERCGACPKLGSDREWDLSRWVWKHKSSVWKNISPYIVTPSQWLADCVLRSSLLQGSQVKVIPYGIDLTVYRPTGKTLARKLLNLPVEKTLLLFGAVNPTQDRRKGFHLLQPALQTLKAMGYSDSVELAIVGTSHVDETLNLGFKIHCLGILRDDLTLAVAYSAADVFIAPSLQDNLPNTVLEALACGTPCVAFDIGGMPDLIDHEINGFLAKPYEVESLANGIAWTMQSDQTQQLGHHAREKAERAFPLQLQASRYQSLFEEVMEQWKTQQTIPFPS